MISIKSIERANPLDREGAKKFYPTVISSGDIDLDELAAELSDATTLNEVDCVAVLYALEKSMVKHLQNDKTLKFGNVGTFKISVSGSGSDKSEDVSVSNVEKARILFSPSLKLKKTLQGLQYKKVQTSLPAAAPNASPEA